MLTDEFKIRVRYSETDQMGFVYHGNYAAYLEVGRVETLRNLGYPYKDLEEKGVLLPLVNLTVNFRKPAVYDDLLTVKTSVKQMPSVKFVFESEIYNAKGDLIVEASVTLVFMDALTKKPTKGPTDLLEKIATYIKKEN
ncbi:MAG: thioesterase family protein [Bacteroidetes bacterium]|nr:thioesterase family protein [Bacteroidota bacterium]